MPTRHNSELNQIPNQPIRFSDEDFGRTEDSLIAKTWDIYIRTREPYSLGTLALRVRIVMDVNDIRLTLHALPLPPLLPRPDIATHPPRSPPADGQGDGARDGRHLRVCAHALPP